MRETIEVELSNFFQRETLLSGIVKDYQVGDDTKKTGRREKEASQDDS